MIAQLIPRLGDRLNRFARRFVPEPIVLAFILTVIVASFGSLLLTAQSDLDAVEIVGKLGGGWLGDFSNPNLLAFGLQMCIVLVTGHVIAMSPLVQRGVAALARLARGPSSAAIIVSLFACAAALIHWGLGAIAGAFLAREIGRHARERDLKIHYPLLGAAAYAGMAVWHGGLSGSAPTLVAKDGVIGLGEMLLSPLNLAVTGSLLVLIPICLAALAPRRDEELTPPPSFQPLPTEPAKTEDDGTGLAGRPNVGRTLGAIGLASTVALIASSRAVFEINTINALFFFTGLILVGRLDRYASLAADGARGAGAIIIQFPLYFGILGLMKASGMIGWLSEGLVSLASKTTLPLYDFVSAGAVNLAIPSGGGQWLVQRDILLGAGEKLGVDPVTTIMAFSYGDAWTNMLQPFWALPLLAIMGLKAKDIIGYTTVVFLLVAAVVPIWLLVLG